MLELKDAVLTVYDHEPDDEGTIRLKVTVDAKYTRVDAEKLSRLIEAAPALLRNLDTIHTMLENGTIEVLRFNTAGNAALDSARDVIEYIEQG
jgi:hypothetical protein